MKVICSFESPLILVFEDLQLLDFETLQLLLAIVLDRNMKNLMLIGTYRTEEVNDNHPLTLLLNTIKSKNLHLTNIELTDLDHEATNDLIANTLLVPPFETYAITAVVHQKTNGNPFYINYTLRDYFEKKIIFYSKDASAWKWDESIFSGEDIQDNAFELLKAKICALDDDTQKTIKIASCLGSPFTLSHLLLVDNCKAGIDIALSKGLIAQYNGSKNMYQFTHDQVQQAGE